MAKYKINNVTADNGAISWAHSGLDTQWAEQGDTVSVYNQPTAGWGLDEIFYTKTDGSGRTDIIGGEFVMPAYDIIIFASFKRFVSTDWTPDPTEGDGIVVEAGSNTTVGGYQVPQLTAEQIADIDAAMAKGKNVVVVDATGKMQFSVNQSDSVDGVAVVIDYFSAMILTYHANGTIDHVNIEGGETSVGAVRYDIEQNLTDEQKQQAQENAGVAEALAEKANIDGYYSQLTAGAAENLVGGNDTSREFTEDTAGGSADIADGIVQIEKINGNTIIWNQLVPIRDNKSKTQYGITFVDNRDGSYTFFTNENGATNTLYVTFTYFNYLDNPKLNGHKILIAGISGGSSSTYNFCDSYGNFIPTTTSDRIRTINGSTRIDFCIRIIKDAIITNPVTVKPQVFDLTQMFGADNEPATVAEFKKMFPLDYYNYNAGQLLSLNPMAIKTVGFNAYNHATGKAYVIGGNQYQITGAYTSITKDAVTITPDSNGKFTPTKNGELVIAGGDSTTTCVHLVWSGVRNGDYEEHWEETRNIPIAKINTDGTITESSTGKTRLFPDGLCSAGSVHDEVTPTKAIKRIGNQTITGTIGDEITLVGCNLSATEYKSVSDYGTLVNGVLTLTAAVTDKDVLYELATPIEVTFAEPLNLTYRVSDFGTETLLPVNGSEPATAPIKMDVVYGLNVVDFVRNADKNFVTIEDGTGDNGSTFTNLRSALSTAFAIDIVPTYDSTNKRYTFAISDNRKVEVPESATAIGLKGTWAEDDTAVYFCTDTNTWVKINKETW